MDKVTTPLKKYYKIQTKNPISMSWIDIQKAYNTIDEAMVNFTDNENMRIMVVEGKKRYLLNASVV